MSLLRYSLKRGGEAINPSELLSDSIVLLPALSSRAFGRQNMLFFSLVTGLLLLDIAQSALCFSTICKLCDVRLVQFRGLSSWVSFFLC